MTGDELKKDREGKNLSQRSIALLLGVTNPSVARWEARPAKEIPGPAGKLLELYFHNKDPFDRGSATPGEGELLRCTFTVDEFQQLQTRAIRAGYTDVKNYITYVLRNHLSETGTWTLTEIRGAPAEPANHRLNEETAPAAPDPAEE